MIGKRLVCSIYLSVKQFKALVKNLSDIGKVLQIINCFYPKMFFGFLFIPSFATVDYYITNFNSKCVFGLSFYSIQCCNNVFYSCFQRAVSRNHLHFKGNHPLKCQLIRISRFGGNKHTDRETHYHSIAS